MNLADDWRISIDDRAIVLYRLTPTVKTSGPHKGETVPEWKQHQRYYSTPELAAAGILRVLVAEQADTGNVTELLDGLTAALDRIRFELDATGTSVPKLVAEQDASKNPLTSASPLT